MPCSQCAWVSIATMKKWSVIRARVRLLIAMALPNDHKQLVKQFFRSNFMVWHNWSRYVWKSGVHTNKYIRIHTNIQTVHVQSCCADGAPNNTLYYFWIESCVCLHALALKWMNELESSLARCAGCLLVDRIYSNLFGSFFELSNKKTGMHLMFFLRGNSWYKVVEWKLRAFFILLVPPA